MLETYVMWIAKYGCQTWTIGEKQRKRIEDFEMSYYRILKIKWVDRITNKEVDDKTKVIE